MLNDFQYGVVWKSRLQRHMRSSRSSWLLRVSDRVKCIGIWPVVGVHGRAARFKGMFVMWENAWGVLRHAFLLICVRPVAYPHKI